MAPWDHGPPAGSGTDDAATAARVSRLGLRLFFIYLALYGAFVLANAFAPRLMEATPVAGLNLAVLFGMSLIVTAFLLAILYGWLCRSKQDGGQGG